MHVTDSEWVPSSPEATWQALHDHEVLLRCLSGCESLQRNSDSEYVLTLNARLAGKPHRFVGRILMSDEMPPWRCQVVFEGTEEHAGLAIGHVDVKLEKADQGGTRVRYALHAAAGGPLAQVEQKHLDQLSSKLVENFFTRFVDYMAQHGQAYEAAMAAPGTASVSGDTGSRSTTSWLMLAGTVVLLALYYMFTR